MKKINYFLIFMILLILLFDFIQKDIDNNSLQFSCQTVQELRLPV